MDAPPGEASGPGPLSPPNIAAIAERTARADLAPVADDRV